MYMNGVKENYTLCVAVTLAQNHVQALKEILLADGGFSRLLLSVNDPFNDFKEVKESNEPLILVIANKVGHDAIRCLCDDYNLPKEQRRVRWIHSLSSGLDSYRLDELTKELQGIPFTNARGCYSSILAEHVVYSMLYFNRQTWRLQESRAAHKWDPFNMVEVRGMKMGIVGYGDIGQAVGRLAVALGMEVTGVKRSPPAEEVDECGVRVVHGTAERDRVICESDFVVNILPATGETRRFFNKERFAMMKSNAVYINIGRGLTQNEEDLADALRNGAIRGAAVDVFEEEPLPTESPLWDFGNDKILLTYHNAFLTDEVFKRTVDLFLSKVKVFGTPHFDRYLISDAEKFVRVNGYIK